MRDRSTSPPGATRDVEGDAWPGDVALTVAGRTTVYARVVDQHGLVTYVERARITAFEHAARPRTSHCPQRSRERRSHRRHSSRTSRRSANSDDPSSEPPPTSYGRTPGCVLTQHAQRVAFTPPCSLSTYPSSLVLVTRAGTLVTLPSPAGRDRLRPGSGHPSNTVLCAQPSRALETYLTRHGGSSELLDALRGYHGGNRNPLPVLGVLAKPLPESAPRGPRLVYDAILTCVGLRLADDLVPDDRPIPFSVRAAAAVMGLDPDSGNAPMYGKRALDWLVERDYLRRGQPLPITLKRDGRRLRTYWPVAPKEGEA
jgi:hypothetical protein